MSELKITGKIVNIIPKESGTSKAGKDFVKQNFVIDTGDEYNPLVCFQLFGDEKVNKFNQYNKVGDKVEVSFNVSSREFNGKYYHNLDAWKVFKDKEEPQQSVSLSQEGEDDLPL